MKHIESIIRQSTRDDDSLNIICFPTFERTESFIANNVNHTFYALQHPSWKTWHKEYADVPQNYILLNPQKDVLQQLPPWITPDLVLSQNRMAHFKVAHHFSTLYNIPLITVEHMSCHPTTGEFFKAKMREMVGDINIFVTDLVRNSWGWPDSFGEIIHNAVDLNLFKRDMNIKKQNYILTVANDFVNRDIYCGYNMWKDTISNLKDDIKVRLVGDNKGLSIPAQNTQELIRFYNEAALLLSTTLVSSLPTTIIEAMACGLPIVSTKTTIIPTLLVEHEYNGFLSNDPQQLAKYCEILIEDEELRNTMGNNARKFVEENFSPDKFLQAYKDVFTRAANIVK